MQVEKEKANKNRLGVERIRRGLNAPKVKGGRECRAYYDEGFTFDS